MNLGAWLPRRPFTLTARLVAVVVLLVAVTATVIGTVITLAMERDLETRLDEQALAALGASNRGPDRDGPDFDPARDILREGTDGFVAVLPQEGDAVGVVRTEDRGQYGDPVALTQDQLDALLDGMPRRTYAGGTVDLPELGSYRVVYRKSFEDTVFVGLHTDDIEHTISELVRLEVLATLLGVLVAGGVGAVVVRRQLAPLREVADTAHRVAELPLASGEIEMTERVPARLTDERTEIGQVGAALNAMLDHVEASLDQRHRSEQQVRQFVADASHELRTPLATIAGYTELARSRPETTGTALDKVETESARMTGLVEDLLLLARLDAGRPLEREPVDLSRLLLEALNDARVLDGDRSWRLVLPDAPLTVTGDEARLHQVVSNLLTNARKYTPVGSTITVTGTAAGFTVHDDGPGFTAELVPRAFERFTRGDAGRTRAGGAGLGLSLVRAIVAAHSGTVDLVSKPGATTVTVTLPPS